MTLDERLSDLVREHWREGKGPNWQAIAGTLNGEGLFNSAGGEWTRHSIRNYYQRHLKGHEESADTKRPPDTQASPTPSPESGPTGNHADGSETSATAISEQRVRAIVREELTDLLRGIEPTSVQKSGRGGAKATTKKSFSLPTELWNQVERLGGIASNHVAAALRIYLRLLDERGSQDPL